MGLKEAADQLLQGQEARDGYFETSVPGLIVMRSSKLTRPECILYRPALCLIVQGAKEIIVGDSRAYYSEGESLVITAEGPTLSQITTASSERPFVGLGLELSIAGMRDMIDELGSAHAPQSGSNFALFVDRTSQEIENCMVRIVQISRLPEAIPLLVPGILREIYYWLLKGANGERIARQICISGAMQRINHVLQHIREAFTQTIRISDLAEIAKMSPASLHQHFKSVTSMTPLQFQKQLRLVQAKHLLLTGGANVTEAAFRVGYESSSQFSREYRRMFGLPPSRDSNFSVLRRSRGAL